MAYGVKQVVMFDRVYKQIINVAQTRSQRDLAIEIIEELADNINNIEVRVYTNPKTGRIVVISFSYYDIEVVITVDPACEIYADFQIDGLAKLKLMRILNKLNMANKGQNNE